VFYVLKSYTSLQKKLVSSRAGLAHAANSTKKQWKRHSELKFRFPNRPTKSEPGP